MTDPTTFVPGYEVTLTPDEYARLKLDPESAEIILLAVTTMAREASDITINLQGPIVVNPAKMMAKQIVLENGKYAIKHPLFTPPASELLPEKGRGAPGRLPAENNGDLHQPLDIPFAQQSFVSLKFTSSHSRMRA